MKNSIFHHIFSVLLLLFGTTAASGQEYRVLSVYFNDICYASSTDRLYGAIPGNRPDGNAVVALNPATGEVEQRIETGSEPTKLVVSKDGKYLYISMFGTPVIKRYNLVTGLMENAFSLNQYFPQFQDYYPDFAELIESIPGQPQSLIALKSYGQIAAYDPAGARAQIGQGSGVKSMAMAQDAQTLWVFQEEAFSRSIVRFSVNAQGINKIASYGTDGNYGFEYLSGRLYMQTGEIYDVSGASGPNLLGKINFGQDFGYYNSVVAPAPGLGPVFAFNSYNSDDPFSPNGFYLRAFDPANFQEQSKIRVPAESYQIDPQKMVCMGAGRVAVLSKENPFYGPDRKLVLFNLAAPCQPVPENLSVTPANPYACAGDTVTLHATPGYSRYYWSDGSTGPTLKVSQSAPDGFWYRVETASGCMSAPSPKSVVTFEPKIRDLTLYSSAQDNTICPGSSCQIYAYSFSVSGGSLQTVFSTGDTTAIQYPVEVKQPGLYSVYAVSEHGCRSNEALIEIFPGLPPTDPPHITVEGNLSACYPSFVFLTAPYNPSGYQWSEGSTTRSITVQWDGPYAVRLVYENGCSSPWSDTITVAFHDAPTLFVQKSGVVLQIQNPFDIADSLQWYQNGLVIPGANGPTLAPSGPGLYSVGNFGNGCSSISLPFAYGVTAANEPGLAPQMRIWPNPTEGNVILESPEALSCTLLNALGEVLEQWEQEAGTATRNLGSRPPGFYRILVKNASNRSNSYKILVVKH